MKIKILLLLLIPVLLIGQDGTREVWVDTVWVSHNAAWKNVTTLIGDSANASILDSLGNMINLYTVWQDAQLSLDTSLNASSFTQWIDQSATNVTKLRTYMYNAKYLKLINVKFHFRAKFSDTDDENGYIRMVIKNAAETTTIDSGNITLSATTVGTTWKDTLLTLSNNTNYATDTMYKVFVYTNFTPAGGSKYIIVEPKAIIARQYLLRSTE